MRSQNGPFYPGGEEDIFGKKGEQAENNFRMQEIPNLTVKNQT